MFSPTFVDIGIFIGTIGFFFVLFLLYSRTFPVIAQDQDDIEGQEIIT
jgi:molybdopterin-containing oxidoreductase family membrane subunit